MESRFRPRPIGVIATVLDVRITDLRIRAESLPNLPNPGAAGASSKGVEPTRGEPTSEEPAGRDWRIWLAAGVGAILLLGLVVAFWQSRRAQSRRAGNAGAVKE